MFRLTPLTQTAVLAIAAFLVVSPLVPLIYQAFLSGPIYEPSSILTVGNFKRLIGMPGFMPAVYNTIVFSVITTIVAQVIGVVTAILIARTDLPGRKYFGGMFLVPMFMSHLVLAIGYYSMFGPTGYVTLWSETVFGGAFWNIYSLNGMAIVAGFSQAPLAYLFCLAATRSTDPTLEDAALMVGAKPMKVLFTITLPLLRPAILVGLSINFVVAIEMLSIPLIFGTASRTELVSTFIYKRIFADSETDYGVVGVAAIILLITVVVLLMLQRLLERNMQRFVVVGGKATRPRRFKLGNLKWPAAIILLVFVITTIIVPIGGLVVRSFTLIFTPLLPLHEVLTLDNYVATFSEPSTQRAMWNTVLVATLTAALGTMLIFLICVVSQRSKYVGASVLTVIAQIPRAIPGIFAGVALLYLVLAVPPLGWIRNTPYILVFAFLTRFIPLGVGAIQPAMNQISTELDKSAYVMGAGWWKANFTILLPMLKPALFACFALIFIHSLKEYVTASFLISPGSEVLGSALLRAWNEGQHNVVASLSTILIIITFSFLAISRKIFGVKIYE